MTVSPCRPTQETHGPFREAARPRESRMPCPDGEQAPRCEHMDQAVFAPWLSACVCSCWMIPSVCRAVKDIMHVDKSAEVKFIEASLCLQVCCALCKRTHSWKALEHVQRKHTRFLCISFSPQVQWVHHVLSTTRQVCESMCKHMFKFMVTLSFYCLKWDVSVIFPLTLYRADLKISLNLQHNAALLTTAHYSHCITAVLVYMAVVPPWDVRKLTIF